VRCSVSFSYVCNTCIMFYYTTKEMCYCYFVLHVPPTFHCSFTVDISLVKLKLKFTCNLPNNKYFTDYFSDTSKTRLPNCLLSFWLVAIFLLPFPSHNVLDFYVVVLSRAYIINRSRFHYCFCHTSLTLRSRVLLETLTVFHQLFVTIKFITINKSARFWSLSLVKWIRPTSSKQQFIIHF
jgi:hypothetical protein